MRDAILIVHAPVDAHVQPKVVFAPGIDHSSYAGDELMDILNRVKYATRRAVNHIETRLFVDAAHVETGPDGRAIVVIDGPAPIGD